MSACAEVSRRRREEGFTLVEVIVIVAVIAIVAGIVVPMIFRQIDEAKITRAEADCKSISSAIFVFRKDLGVWPDRFGAGCTPDADLLYGNGNLPEGLVAKGYATANGLNFQDVLSIDDQGCYDAGRFKGPYLPAVDADPWGNAYFLAGSNFGDEEKAAFALSAGPNGVVDTPVFALTPEGDDVGVVVKAHSKTASSF